MHKSDGWHGDAYAEFVNGQGFEDTRTEDFKFVSGDVEL